MKKEEQERQKRDLDRVHRLMQRLPWIVVAVSLLATLITIVQLYVSSRF